MVINTNSPHPIARHQDCRHRTGEENESRSFEPISSGNQMNASEKKMTTKVPHGYGVPPNWQTRKTHAQPSTAERIRWRRCRRSF